MALRTRTKRAATNRSLKRPPDLSPAQSLILSRLKQLLEQNTRPKGETVRCIFLRIDGRRWRIHGCQTPRTTLTPHVFEQRKNLLRGLRPKSCSKRSENNQPANAKVVSSGPLQPYFYFYAIRSHEGAILLYATSGFPRQNCVLSV